LDFARSPNLTLQLTNSVSNVLLVPLANSKVAAKKISERPKLDDKSKSNAGTPPIGAGVTATDCWKVG